MRTLSLTQLTARFGLPADDTWQRVPSVTPGGKSLFWHSQQHGWIAWDRVLQDWDHTPKQALQEWTQP